MMVLILLRHQNSLCYPSIQKDCYLYQIYMYNQCLLLLERQSPHYWNGLFGTYQLQLAHLKKQLYLVLV